MAWLAYEWRDLAAAEDALSSALEKALTLWPAQGVPAAPEAWLLTVARRELLQAARRTRLHESPQVQAWLADELSDELSQQGAHSGGAPGGFAGLGQLPDSRLKLLFVCAHPAIDAGVRPALMLQAVLGLQAQQIAQVLLSSPAAIAQRLVRAKQKIRDAGLRFEEPGPDELPERLHAVLEAIYAAYGFGWDAGDSADGGDALVQGLRAEALFLADLVCSLLPADAGRAEAEGLLALMLFCEARVPARRGPAGQFVPLADQDTGRWSRPMIEQANQLLWAASRWRQPGAFQMEAAIQSAHCQRLETGAVPWPGIVTLYQRLLGFAPSLGAAVAHAVASAHAGDVPGAAALLADLDHPRLASYQPYWVATAHVRGLAGQLDGAQQALQQAIGLTASPAVRAHLLRKLAQMSREAT